MPETLTIEDLSKKVGELGVTLSEATKRADRSDNVIKLSPEERTTFDTLPVEKQDAFLAGDETVRKAMMPEPKKGKKVTAADAEDAAEGDEPVTKSAGEVELEKKLEDLSKQVDTYKAKTEAAETIAKQERATRLKVEFEKRAESDFPALPGTVVEKGAVLQAITSKLTTEEVAEVTKLLIAGNEALKTLGVSKGSDAPAGDTSGDAWGKIETLAKAEVVKAGGLKKLSIEKATQQVLEENPKLYEAYIAQK